MDWGEQLPRIWSLEINCLLLLEIISDRFNIKSVGLCYPELQGLWLGQRDWGDRATALTPLGGNPNHHIAPQQ